MTTRKFARRKPALSPFSYYLPPLSLRPSTAFRSTACAMLAHSASFAHRAAPDKTSLHCWPCATAKFSHALFDKCQAKASTVVQYNNCTEATVVLTCCRSMRRLLEPHQLSNQQKSWPSRKSTRPTPLPITSRPQIPAGRLQHVRTGPSLCALADGHVRTEVGTAPATKRRTECKAQ